MHRLKPFVPLAVGLLIHLYSIAAMRYPMIFTLDSGLHHVLSVFPWTTYDGLVPLCELLQRILCAYFFFLVLEVLRDTWILRRLLSAAALALGYLFVSITFILLLAFPFIPDSLSLLVPIILLALAIWVALTYARECGKTADAHGSIAAQ